MWSVVKTATFLAFLLVSTEIQFTDLSKAQSAAAKNGKMLLILIHEESDGFNNALLEALEINEKLIKGDFVPVKNTSKKLFELFEINDPPFFVVTDPFLNEIERFTAQIKHYVQADKNISVHAKFYEDELKRALSVYKDEEPKWQTGTIEDALEKVAKDPRSRGRGPNRRTKPEEEKKDNDDASSPESKLIVYFFEKEDGSNSKKSLEAISSRLLTHLKRQNRLIFFKSEFDEESDYMKGLKVSKEGGFALVKIKDSKTKAIDVVKSYNSAPAAATLYNDLSRELGKIDEELKKNKQDN